MSALHNSALAAVRKHGVMGLGASSQKSPYFQAMEELQTKHPALKEYIGQRAILTGSGWSYDVSMTYGLTFQGIREVLAQLKIDAPVAESREQLIEALEQIKGRGVVVIDSSLLVWRS